MRIDQITLTENGLPNVPNYSVGTGDLASPVPTGTLCVNQDIAT
jgi:hypothetical protein